MALWIYGMYIYVSSSRMVTFGGRSGYASCCESSTIGSKIGPLPAVSYRNRAFKASSTSKNSAKPGAPRLVEHDVHQNHVDGQPPVVRPLQHLRAQAPAPLRHRSQLPHLHRGPWRRP